MSPMADDDEHVQCIDCGKVSPPTETPFTLIGQQHGWRVVIEKIGNRREPVWRCPTCWDQRKRSK